MDYKLKKPLQVMNKEAGEYETADIIVVEFKGKKGLTTLKRLQDVIFKTLTQQSTNAGAGANKDAKKQEKDVTIDELLSILEMTGASEKLFDEVTGALKAFATIGTDNLKLSDILQEDMSIEDLDELYHEVLKHFFLPKITSKMNSMSK